MSKCFTMPIGVEKHLFLLQGIFPIHVEYYVESKLNMAAISDESIYSRVECLPMPAIFAALSSRRWLIVIMLVAAVLAGTLYYRGVPDMALVPAGAPLPAAGPVPPGKPVMPKGYQPELAVRDPFAVPREFQPKSIAALPAPAGDRQIRQKEILPVLNGVIMAGNIGSAIIQYGADSRSYRRGDFVGPYQIVAINSQSVTLQGPEGRLALSVGR
jgi:hypothetical protein